MVAVPLDWQGATRGLGRERRDAGPFPTGTVCAGLGPDIADDPGDGFVISFYSWMGIRLARCVNVTLPPVVG